MASWLALRAAVHDLDLEEQDWVDALHAEARELLDEGLGTFSYSYRIEPGPRIHLGAVAGHETAPELWRALSLWGGENESALACIYKTSTGSLEKAVSSAARAGIALSDPRRRFEPHGVADLLTVVGHDPKGFGIFLTVPRARASVQPLPKQRRAFERLAVELSAASRLREHRRRARSARLSSSELRVARLLMDGASDKFIASELGVSVSTVSTFTQRVRKKLGCRSGEEALLLHTRVRSTHVHRRLALFDRLTISECDVASELLVGSSYADIAERRGVSVRTVASQCGVIFRKCSVSGRRELASILLGG
jgi:DNA-binding NarL/FixJ family response regulator